MGQEGDWLNVGLEATDAGRPDCPSLWVRERIWPIVLSSVGSREGFERGEQMVLLTGSSYKSQLTWGEIELSQIWYDI